MNKKNFDSKMNEKIDFTDRYLYLMTYCLKKKKNNQGIFHFKGFYAGYKINSVELYFNDEENQMINLLKTSYYLIYVKVKGVSSKGVLMAEIDKLYCFNDLPQKEL